MKDSASIKCRCLWVCLFIFLPGCLCSRLFLQSECVWFSRFSEALSLLHVRSLYPMSRPPFLSRSLARCLHVPLSLYLSIYLQKSYPSLPVSVAIYHTVALCVTLCLSLFLRVSVCQSGNIDDGAIALDFVVFRLAVGLRHWKAN